MKRFFCILMLLVTLFSITACNNGDKEKNSATETQLGATWSEIHSEGQNESFSVSNTVSEIDSKSNEEENNMIMNIQIGEHVLTAELVQNSSTQALIEMLSAGPVTINMNDYAGMEKVGPFPKSLPRNDEQISTDACDLILYQGNSFVIYYDTNSWNFTRLGKIKNVTKQELREILGNGSITAVLSLPAK